MNPSGASSEASRGAGRQARQHVCARRAVCRGLRSSSLRTVEWRSVLDQLLPGGEPSALDDAPQIRLAAAQWAAAAEQPCKTSWLPSTRRDGLRVREMLERAASILSQAARPCACWWVRGRHRPIILAGASHPRRCARAREAALLKTLGQTRLRVAAVFSVEYALSGAVSGVLGAGGGLRIGASFTRQV